MPTFDTRLVGHDCAVMSVETDDILAQFQNMTIQISVQRADVTSVRDHAARSRPVHYSWSATLGFLNDSTPHYYYYFLRAMGANSMADLLFVTQPYTGYIITGQIGHTGLGINLTDEAQLEGTDWVGVGTLSAGGVEITIGTI